MAVRLGPTETTLTVSDKGYRTYSVTWLVASAFTEGPLNALLATGMPLPGTYWNQWGMTRLGSPDIYCWCRYPHSIRPYRTNEKEKVKFWLVGQTFSNEPLSLDNAQQDQTDFPNDNPVLDPPKVSGSFVKMMEEAQYDRLGKEITTSAKERFVGPQVEYDLHNPTVHIEFNVATFDLAYFTNVLNLAPLNDATLWGCPVRTVKFSNFTWTKNYYQGTFPYYTLALDFEIAIRGWDRTLQDEGTLVLQGAWKFPTSGGSPPGSGATVDTTVSGGKITGVTLNAAGSAYEASKTFHLSVTSGGSGKGSVVQVITNGSGAVTAVSLLKGGTGYTAGTNVALSSPIGYYLTSTTRYQRYQDPNGNLATVVLNGAGSPIGTGMEPGKILVEKDGESNLLLLGIPSSF